MEAGGHDAALVRMTIVNRAEPAPPHCRLYARRKQFPLQNITVSLSHARIHAEDCEACETKQGLLDRIDLRIELTGPLTPDQHARLLEIAGKCPVHRTLKSEIDIRLRPA